MADYLSLRRGTPKHNEPLDVLTYLADKHGSPTQACINLLRDNIEYKLAVKALKKKRRKQ
jgi:hypothetical protein